MKINNSIKIFISLFLIISVSAGNVIADSEISIQFLSPESPFAPLTVEMDETSYTLDRTDMPESGPGESFRDSASFSYLSHIMGIFLHLGIETTGALDLLETELENIDITGLYLKGLFIKDGSIFIPYQAAPEESPVLLRFFLNDTYVGEAKDTDIAIENKKVSCEAMKIRNAEPSHAKGDISIPEVRLEETYIAGKGDGKDAHAFFNTADMEPLFTEKNMMAIEKAISQKSGLFPTGRSVYVKLPETVTIDGREYTEVYIKGVVFDESKPYVYQQNGSPGYVPDPLRTDENGRIYIGPPKPDVIGGMFMGPAQNAFLQHYLMYHNQGLKNKDIYVSAPLGYGYYPNAPRHGNKLMGFVILGADKEMPKRLGKHALDVQRIARSMREMHNEGFSHPFLHLGNIIWNGKKIYIHDMDEVEYMKYTDNNRKKAVISYLRDMIYFYLKFAYHDLHQHDAMGKRIFSKDTGYNKQLGDRGMNKVFIFVETYFSDLPQNERDEIFKELFIFFDVTIDSWYRTDNISISFDKVHNEIEHLLSALEKHVYDKRSDSAGRTRITPALYDKMLAEMTGAEKDLRREDHLHDSQVHKDIQPFQYERNVAEVLGETLKMKAYSEAKRDKTLVIGIDTSWIPEDQLPIIQPLLSSLRSASRTDKSLKIVLGKGESLADEIERETSDLDISRAIVIGELSSINSDKFTALKTGRLKDKYTYIEISTRYLREISDVRILEIILIALKLGYGHAVFQEDTSIYIRKDYNDDNTYCIIPGAEPCDIEDLKTIYTLQARILRSL